MLITPSDLSTLVTARKTTIVVYDDGDQVATLAAKTLAAMGYTDVRVLDGGLAAWRAAGGAVEVGQPATAVYGYDAARAQAKTLAPRALHAELSGVSAPLVIDVDENDAYAAGHISSAMWLCRSRLERAAPSAIGAGRAVIVTCRDGVMSTLSIGALEAAGVDPVRVLAGGKRAGAADGLALESGATKLGDDADDVVLKSCQRGRAAMEAYLRWETDLDAEGGSPHAWLPGVPKP